MSSGGSVCHCSSGCRDSRSRRRGIWYLAAAPPRHPPRHPRPTPESRFPEIEIPKTPPGPHNGSGTRLKLEGSQMAGNRPTHQSFWMKASMGARLRSRLCYDTHDALAAPRCVSVALHPHRMPQLRPSLRLHGRQSVMKNALDTLAPRQSRDFPRLRFPKRRQGPIMAPEHV